MSELCDLTLTQAVQALRNGEVSSLELTQACLERIERLEPALHAFITRTPELARQQAEAADARLAYWRKDPQDALPPYMRREPA